MKAADMEAAVDSMFDLMDKLLLLLLLFQITTATMKAADVETAVDSVFGLMDKWGHENYIGEQVTQLQHAQQVCRH